MLHKKVIRLACFLWLVVIGLGVSSNGEQRATDPDPSKLPAADVTMLAVKGSDLTPEEAAELEAKITADPNDLAARTQLLGYYSLKAFKNDDARKRRQNHVIWIIQNHPESETAGLPFASLDPSLDKERYFQAKKLWLKHIEAQKGNLAILANAANFFLIYDKDVAEDLLKKAQAIEPGNPAWSSRLGQLYELRMNGSSSESTKEAAIKALQQLEKTMQGPIDEMERLSLLSRLAGAAFEADQLEKARRYAVEMLDTVAQNKPDWNSSNAVHHGNLILGRLALKAGDIEKAKEHLLAAGRTSGSPQLNSFGPNMTLAKELLENGERDAVIEYLELCANFWKGKRDRLKNWTATVRGGGVPDFGANLVY